MSDIQKGYTYTSGAPGNQVTADNLNQLVDGAVVQPALLTAKTEKTTPDPNDLLLIADSANGNAFKKLRVSNLPTGGSTTIVNQSGNGLTEFRNLTIVNHTASPSTTLDITVDEITIGKTNGTQIFLQNVSASANITLSGAGGLDTGSEAGSTWYYVYVISDGTTTSALLSVSATAPTLPGAYVYFGLVGAIRNDGNSDFWKIIQRDKDVSHVTVGLTYGSSAVSTFIEILGGSPTLYVCPLAKKLSGFVFSHTNVDCSVQLAADSLGTGSNVISAGSSGNPLALSYLTSEGNISTTLANTNSYASGNFSIAVLSTGELWIKTDAQTTHWTVALSGYSL